MEDSKESLTTEEVMADEPKEEEKPAEEEEAKTEEKGAPAVAEDDTKEETPEETKDEATTKEDKHESTDAAAAAPKDTKKRKSAPAPASSSSSSPAVKRERRDRKSAEAFQPEDFKHVDKSITIVPGRGKELGAMKATLASIEAKSNSEDIVLAHKLLFSSRVKAPKKEMKADLLAFSGYLPKIEEGLDKKEQDALDEEFEAKMGAKTYRMTVPQLKKMCDFFAIDRMNCNGKDALVDVLLDFLGEPEENMLKGSAKAKGKADSSSSSKKKSKAKKVEAADDDAGDYSDVGDDGKEEATTKEGELPSDEALRKWVRAYVRCHNMKQSTIKHALEIAGEKFGVDLSEKKQRLKELLTEEM